MKPEWGESGRATWLKDRKSEKGMEEFIVAEIAADLGGFNGVIHLLSGVL